MKEQEINKDHLLNYHTSDYMIIKHQVAIKDTETVKAKLTFEREDKIQ